VSKRVVMVRKSRREKVVKTTVEFVGLELGKEF